MLQLTSSIFMLVFMYIADCAYIHFRSLDNMTTTTVKIDNHLSFSLSAITVL